MTLPYYPGNSYQFFFFWLVVSTPLKNISQIGSFPQVGLKIKNIWNHHLVVHCSIYLSISRISPKIRPAPSAVGETGQEPPFQSGDVCLGQVWGDGGSLLGKTRKLTPRKINMEPQIHPIEKENHLPNHHFQVLCWSSGVYPTKLTGKWTVPKIIGPQRLDFFQGEICFFRSQEGILFSKTKEAF